MIILLNLVKYVRHSVSSHLQIQRSEVALSQLCKNRRVTIGEKRKDLYSVFYFCDLLPHKCFSLRLFF